MKEVDHPCKCLFVRELRSPEPLVKFPFEWGKKNSICNSDRQACLWLGNICWTRKKVPICHFFQLRTSYLLGNGQNTYTWTQPGFLGSNNLVSPHNTTWNVQIPKIKQQQKKHTPQKIVSHIIPADTIFHCILASPVGLRGGKLWAMSKMSASIMCEPIKQGIHFNSTAISFSCNLASTFVFEIQC